jgi:hypothetical protein
MILISVQQKLGYTLLQRKWRENLEVGNRGLVMVYCFTQLVGIKCRGSLVKNGRPNNHEKFCF